jgi:hypothetical protein
LAPSAISLKLIYSLFYIYNSVYNIKSYFETVICKSLNLNRKQFYNLFFVKARTQISKSKLNHLDKLIKNNLIKINKKLLNKI